MTAGVDLKGYKEYEALLRKAKKSLGMVDTATLKDVLRVGYEIAYRECPEGKTKFLKSSISYNLQRTADGTEVGELRVDAPYAAYVNFGCFFSQNIDILTKRGWVKYKDLIPNYDYVFTHKERWRKILDKFSYLTKNITQVTITLETGDKLTITGNHPIYNGNWINAEDIKVGDMVYTVHNDLPHFHWRNFKEPASIKGKNLKMNLTKVIKINQRIIKKATVYNFSVEEDESYVSNHIVTHNTSRNRAKPFFSRAVIAMKIQLLKMLKINVQKALSGQDIDISGPDSIGGNIRTPRKYLYQTRSRSGSKRYVYSSQRAGTIKFRGKQYRGRNFAAQFESA